MPTARPPASHGARCCPEAASTTGGGPSAALALRGDKSGCGQGSGRPTERAARMQHRGSTTRPVQAAAAIGQQDKQATIRPWSGREGLEGSQWSSPGPGPHLVVAGGLLPLRARLRHGAGLLSVAQRQVQVQHGGTRAIHRLQACGGAQRRETSWLAHAGEPMCRRRPLSAAHRGRPAHAGQRIPGSPPPLSSGAGATGVGTRRSPRSHSTCPASCHQPPQPSRLWAGEAKGVASRSKEGLPALP